MAQTRTTTKTTILLLEDNPGDVRLIREHLAETLEGEHEVECVHRLAAGIDRAVAGEIDLILLDLSLPDSSGLETFGKMQSAAPQVPIIVLTGLNDEAVATEAVRLGAQDYLVKGEGGANLLSRSIRYAIERKRLEDRLRQSQKMEAIGQLAGGIAHDFNNLLTGINGFSDMLLADFDKDHPSYHALQQIQYAGERAAALTRQLLAFSRKQVLAPKVLNLNIRVAEMEKLLQRLIGEDINLVTHLDPALGLVKVDPGQIEQVIMNLAVNARDAMQEGGTLTIETHNVDLDSLFPDSLDQPIAEGRYVMLAVTDTGSGMSAEIKARIFEPFFTTKPQGKGTGLGLATCYGIMKQSGGHISVYSEPGQGTSFKVYFPRVSGEAQEVPEDEIPDQELNGSETVLLVEDEPVVRDLTASVLQARGYTVLQARDGAEALTASKNHRRRIHLLLTDTVMPGMNGRELAERLLAKRPDTKVLYMSGYTDKAIVQHGILGPGIAFLQKPFKARALAAKVREVLGKHGKRDSHTKEVLYGKDHDR